MSGVGQSHMINVTIDYRLRLYKISEITWSFMILISLRYYFAGMPETSSPWSSTLPVRVIIHGYNPNETTTEGETSGKLVHLPDSIDELFRLAGKPYLRLLSP